MSSLTPQEKKRLSYERDRRNSYGQNAKASRKAIPLRKKKARRAYRKVTNQLLPKNADAAVLVEDESIEAKIKSVKTDTWRKAPDMPLGEFVKRQKVKRVGRFHRRDGKVPLPGLPGCFTTVPNVIDHEGILRPKKKR